MNERTTMNRKPVFRVPVKTVLNLNSGFREKLLCDGPTFSLGDSCAYSCAFCYVPAQFRTFAMVCPSLPRPGGDYKAAALEFRDRLRYDRSEHVWAEVINLRGESFTRTVRALDDAGLGAWADEMEKVAEDPHHHEHYTRHTFLGHVEACKGMPGKLRFLVYPRPQWRSWWETQIAYGAVIL